MENRDGWYRYSVRGILERTNPNRMPEEFVIKGKVHESWSLPGDNQRRYHPKAEVLVPGTLQDRINPFLEKLALGTPVIFKEAAKRVDGKMISHSFSVEVVEKKGEPKKRR